MAVDTKYGDIDIEGIPDDEPVFVIRAKDEVSVQTLNQYADNATRNGSPSEHHASVRRRAAEFQEWQDANPDLVKTPD